MEQGSEITTKALKGYLCIGFPFGQSFAPGYPGWTLHEPGTGNVSIHFAKWMDENDYVEQFPYLEIVGVFEGMRRLPEVTSEDEKMNGLHRTLLWWCFYRREGVTTEVFAEREGVTDRTIRVRMRQALTYIERALKEPPPPANIVTFPPSFVPFAAAAN